MSIFDIPGKASVNAKMVAGVTKGHDDSQVQQQQAFLGQLSTGNPTGGRYLLIIYLNVYSPTSVMPIRFNTERDRDQAYDKAVSDMAELSEF